ncbi:MAG: ABC transporter substrate-binding protein [Thermoleophilia bacterium]|nr:ABC transporter substrate-binding protein [Thermoleophilia bacterium]
MRYLRPVICSFLLALLVTTLTACGGSSSATGETTTETTTTETAPGDQTTDVTLDSPHRGGTMKVVWNGFGSSIDPGVDYDGNWTLLRITNDGLVAWKRVSGQDGNTLVPNLAEELPIPTNGGLTYTFKVRKGVKFSTGQEVKPSDFKATIERQFKLPGPVASFYAVLLGGAACEASPAAGKKCDLGKGIIADDNAMTLTFKLKHQDADFLQKLALPFAYALPADTSPKETSVTPLPATGPYMIESYKPNVEMVMVRNPEFTQWSRDAQPNGYPDRIEFNLALTPNEGTTQVENGDADWIADQIPTDRLGAISEKYPEQIAINPNPQVYHMVLNTQVPPFDNLKVRQALNYATDRKALVQLWGGPKLAEVTCQILPPNFPSYKPYCPWTKNPGETWTAPDLAKAKKLIAASGTKGMKVVVIGTPDESTTSFDLYFIDLLKSLGYDASRKTLQSSVEYPYVQDSANKAQISRSYWYPDYPAPADFLDIVVGCSGYHPNSTANPNLSMFCDPAIDAKTRAALAKQITDPAAAVPLWTEIDRLTTDAAPWVPLFVASRLDFVSPRIGNFQYNPSVVGGFMIESAWVQ